MPTVILLDASLSMLRPVDCGRRSYAEHSRKERKTANNDSSSIGTVEDTGNSFSIDGSRDISGNSPVNSNIQLMDLAKWGIDKLLSHFELAYKLEQVAVLSYSSQCDLVVPFTRDISEIRGKVKVISRYNMDFPVIEVNKEAIAQDVKATFPFSIIGDSCGCI